jgi:hypothetical protein
MDLLPFIFPVTISAAILFSSVPLPLAILDLDTSAVPGMSLDASAKVSHRSRGTILNAFSDRFEEICA